MRASQKNRKNRQISKCRGEKKTSTNERLMAGFGTPKHDIGKNRDSKYDRSDEIPIRSHRKPSEFKTATILFLIHTPLLLLSQEYSQARQPTILVEYYRTRRMEHSV